MTLLHVQGLSPQSSEELLCQPGEESSAMVGGSGRKTWTLLTEAFTWVPLIMYLVSARHWVYPRNMGVISVLPITGFRA